LLLLLLLVVLRKHPKIKSLLVLE